MKILIAFAITLFCFSCSSQKAELATAKFGGSYEFGEDIEKGAVGFLKVYPESDSTALFHLELNRGAPSYNLGWTIGKMVFKNDTATYIGDCKINVVFKKNSAEISSLGDCGYGFGVEAKGSFKKVSNDIPEFFIDGHGDTTYFKNFGAKLNKNNSIDK